MELQMWKMWHPPPIFDVIGRLDMHSLLFLTKDWIGVPSRSLDFRKIHYLSGGGCSFGASENSKHMFWLRITYNYVHLYFM